MTRVAHVISEFSAHEAMGRTIAHHLVTTRVHDAPDRFASVHEVGGSISTFVVSRSRQVAAALDDIDPDVVHLHGGALTPLWAHTAGLRGYQLVQTIYGWPKLPSYRSWRASGLELRALRRSNVLRARVAVTSLLPDRMVAGAIRRSPTEAVLTPDATVERRLGRRGVLTTRLGSGAEVSVRRAAHSIDRPTILFAGRAERVRGIETLVDAFELVVRSVPEARLRLLLIPTPDLEAVLARVRRSPQATAIDICVEPVDDLDAELAAAQVGAWPFHFDYTTSPPAMAVAEAMAVGLPVVATAVGCVESVASDGIDADLVPVGDATVLADRLVRLLRDPQLWTERSAAGRATITRGASWSGAAGTVRQAYRAAAPNASASAGATLEPADVG
jgi:glycosyltransferase involved in cell wall biosynthesis